MYKDALREFRWCFDDSAMQYFVICAFQDGHLAGLVAICEGMVNECVWHIPWLCVDEAYRGRGLGHDLLQAAEAFVRQECLSVPQGVLHFTTTVPDFYKAYGYAQIFDCQHDGTVMVAKNLVRA